MEIKQTKIGFMFMFLLAIALFVSAEVSAIELNPFANSKTFVPELKADMSDFLKEDFNSKYGVIQLSKTRFWFETDKIAEYSLIENTDQCLINCKSKGKAVLYTDGKLFDDKYFLNKKGIEVEIDSQYYIKEIETYYEDVPQYKEVCSMQKIISNSTIKDTNLLEKPINQEVCNQELIGYEKVEKTKEVWNEYNFEVLKAGEYEWEIRGSKATSQSVDFIPTAHGKSLNEWAWWQSEWKYRRLINLTANVGNFSYLYEVPYSANMQNDYDDLRFVNSAEDTELNFTIQSYNATSAIVRIFSMGETEIYMYYGNPLATSASSASNTHFNPIAYYYLDETSGTTAYDALGNYNGTNNGATPNIAGKIEKAYDYDGSNDVITFGTQLVPTSSAFSVSMWINSDQIGTEKSLISQAGSSWSSSSWRIILYANGKIFMDKSGFNSLSSSTTLTANTWYFVTVTSTGSVAKIYINGVLEDTKSVTFSGAYNTYLGALQTESYWNGKIDEVGIWNRALSSTEVTELYTYTAPTYTIGEEEVQEGATITLNSPANNVNLTYSTINFNATIQPKDATIKNVTLYLNENEYLDLYDTNETINYSKILTLEDGDYTWNVTACWIGESLVEDCTESDTRTFRIDTTPPNIKVTSGNGTYPYYYSGINHTVNFTVEDDNLDSGWWGYGEEGMEILDTNLSSNLFDGNFSTVSLPDYDKEYYILLNGKGGNLNISLSTAPGIGDYSYFSSSLIPTNSCLTNIIKINTSANIGEYSSGYSHSFYCGNTYLGKVDTYAGFFGDKLMSEIQAEGITYSLSGTLNISEDNTYSVTFPVTKDVYDFSIYANDTSGNVASKEVEWDYLFFEENRSYPNETIDTKQETISIDITSLYDLTVNLNYSGTIYPTLEQIIAPNKIRYYTILNIPNVAVNTNKTISWNIYSNQGNATTTESSILVKSLNYSFNQPRQLLNITIYDEITGDKLNNTQVEALVTYYLQNPIANKTLYEVHTNNNHTLGTNLEIDSLYTKNKFTYQLAGYQPREYLENLILVDGSITQLTLYLLSNSDGTTQLFSITEATTMEQLADVKLIAYEQVGTEYQYRDATYSDDSGSANLWLNPDKAHRITASKEGCTSKTISMYPTGVSIQNIELDCGGVIPGPSYNGSEYYTEYNITVSFNPTIKEISYDADNSLTHNKTFSVKYEDQSCNVTGAEFKLIDGDTGLVLNTITSLDCEDTLSLIQNVSGKTGIIAYLLLTKSTGETLTYRIIYRITDISDLAYDGSSISRILQKLTDMDDFGLDQKTKTFIAFIVLFLILGGLSMGGVIKSEGFSMYILILAYIAGLSYLGWFGLELPTTFSNATIQATVNKYMILFLSSLIIGGIALSKAND